MQIEISARILFACCALVLLLGVLQMIRKGSIKEKHSLLWIPLSLLFAMVCFFPSSLVWISQKMHLHYITVVVLCVIVAFTLILLYFTMKLSQLREDVQKLAQTIALHRAGSDGASEDRNLLSQNTPAAEADDTGPQ